MYRCIITIKEEVDIRKLLLYMYEKRLLLLYFLLLDQYKVLEILSCDSEKER